MSEPAPDMPGLADPALRTAVRALAMRLPAYGRLYWRLLRHGHLSAGHRALAIGALAYTISPVDLVPGIIPVIGQMDDLAVALIGLRLILRSMPSAVAEAHLQATGLSLAQLDADLTTLGRAAAALGRESVRLASAATLVGARRLGAGLRQMLRGQRRQT